VIKIPNFEISEANYSHKKCPKWPSKPHFLKFSLQNWVRLPLVLAFVKITKTAFFGENWCRLISPRTAAGVIFLCFLCIRFRAFKMRRLALRDKECPWRGFAKKKGLKMHPRAQKIFYTTLRFFFRWRFLILSRKPAQITQFRWDLNLVEMRQVR